MARSYVRSRSRRKNGILVREAAVARGVPTNSLFSVPMTGKVAAGDDQIAVSITLVGSNQTLTVGDRSTPMNSLPGKLVRASSVTVASKSPFTVKVLNSAGGYTCYEIKGQIPTKINLSRESSVLGNPAILRTQSAGSALSGITLISTTKAEDAVDIKLNLVVDSSLDD